MPFVLSHDHPSTRRCRCALPRARTPSTPSFDSRPAAGQRTVSPSHSTHVCFCCCCCCCCCWRRLRCCCLHLHHRMTRLGHFVAHATRSYRRRDLVGPHHPNKPRVAMRRQWVRRGVRRVRRARRVGRRRADGRATAYAGRRRRAGTRAGGGAGRCSQRRGGGPFYYLKDAAPAHPPPRPNPQQARCGCACAGAAPPSGRLIRRGPHSERRTRFGHSVLRAPARRRLRRVRVPYGPGATNRPALRTRPALFGVHLRPLPPAAPAGRRPRAAPSRGASSVRQPRGTPGVGGAVQGITAAEGTFGEQAARFTTESRPDDGGPRNRWRNGGFQYIHIR